jgi:glycosyltransferase involved in cell wall biosynthesis
MPVFNAEATLARSVESVLAQGFASLELIVVDDGSSDGSVGIVEQAAARDSRVRLLRQPANAGVAEARNAGIAAARGTHVAFLDSDDWWHPSKLELQVLQMHETGVRVSYCAYQRVAEDGRLLSVVMPPAEVGYPEMLRSNHIGNLTGMYDRSLGDGQFQAVGHEDYVFWLDRVRLAGRAKCIRHDGPLAYYLVREGSISSNKWRAGSWQWRIYRRREGFGVLRSTWYMAFYVANALVKRRADRR